MPWPSPPFLRPRSTKTLLRSSLYSVQFTRATSCKLQTFVKLILSDDAGLFWGPLVFSTFCNQDSDVLGICSLNCFFNSVFADDFIMWWDQSRIKLPLPPWTSWKLMVDILWSFKIIDLVSAISIILTILKTTISILFHQSLDLVNFENRSQPEATLKQVVST